MAKRWLQPVQKEWFKLWKDIATSDIANHPALYGIVTPESSVAGIRNTDINKLTSIGYPLTQDGKPDGAQYALQFIEQARKLKHYFSNTPAYILNNINWIPPNRDAATGEFYISNVIDTLINDEASVPDEEKVFGLFSQDIAHISNYSRIVYPELAKFGNNDHLKFGMITGESFKDYVQPKEQLLDLASHLLPDNPDAKVGHLLFNDGHEMFQDNYSPLINAINSATPGQYSFLEPLSAADKFNEAIDNGDASSSIWAGDSWKIVNQSFRVFGNLNQAVILQELDFPVLAGKFVSLSAEGRVQNPNVPLIIKLTGSNGFVKELIFQNSGALFETRIDTFTIPASVDYLKIKLIKNTGQGFVMAKNISLKDKNGTEYIANGDASSRIWVGNNWKTNNNSFRVWTTKRSSITQNLDVNALNGKHVHFFVQGRVTNSTVPVTVTLSGERSDKSEFNKTFTFINTGRDFASQSDSFLLPGDLNYLKIRLVKQAGEGFGMVKNISLKY